MTTTALPDSIEQLLHALRRLVRERRFTFVFVATLALGLAANMAVFAVLDAYLLRPLPYPGSSRLVEIYTNARKIHLQRLSSAAYRVLKRLPVLSDSGLIRDTRTATVRLQPGAAPHLFPAAYVTASLFPTLGIPPLLGRWPSAASRKPGGPREVVLSKTLWQSAFGGNPGALGKTLVLHRQAFTVVGIMPGTFAFPSRRTKIWISTRLHNENQRNPFDEVDSLMIARRAPGVTPGQLQDALDSGFRRLMRQASPRLQVFIRHAGGYAGFRTLRHGLVGSTGKRLLIIQLGAGLLLMLAFSSLTNLALVRQLDQFHEAALRTALGARSRNVIPSLLGEAGVLAGLATLLAWPLARLGTGAFVSFGIASRHTAFRTGQSAWSWLALWLLATLTAFLVIGLPRLVLPRRNLRALLAGGSRVLESVTIGRLRVGLSLVQIALAILLLVATVLVGTSLAGMLVRNPGFRDRHLDVAEVLLPTADRQHWTRFQADEGELKQLLEGLPGHPAVGIGLGIPFLGGNRSVFVRGLHFHPGKRNVFASDMIVGAGTLPLLGVHLQSGRLIGERDIVENAHVVDVDQSLAEGLFGSTHVLGKTISGLDSGLRIVGVVGSIHDRLDPADRDLHGTVIYPDERSIFPVALGGPLDVLLRSRTAPSRLHREIASALNRTLPDLVLARFTTLRTVIRRSVRGTFALVSLIGAFGLLALVLASIGTFGVIAYLVSTQEREFALREALGATPGAIAFQVFRKGVWLWLAGSALGVVAAWWATHLLAHRLYGLDASRPLGYILPVLAVGLVVLAACGIPALRLRRLSLLRVLRS